MRPRPLPAWRIAFLLLLVAGSAVRPLLTIACDLHAAVNAHASNPHDHAGDAFPDDAPDAAHGEHEYQFAGEGKVLPALTLMADVPALPGSLVPVFPRAAERADARAGPPFRPPIA